jgi:MuDR family transposase/MULE transposase domain
MSTKCKEKDTKSLLMAGGDNEVNSDYEESDELESVDDYNDEDGESNSRRISEFRIETDMGNPKFTLGMIFSSKSEFRDAVKEYGIKNRVNIKFYKNDKKRMGARCKEGCEWNIYASKFNDDPSDPTFQVKTHKSKHSCARTYENKHLTYKWLAKHYLWKFEADPKWSLLSFRAEISKDFTIHCPTMKLWRARNFAIKMIEGTHEEQYCRVDSYAQEVRLTNPGSTLICKRNEGLFLRFYVCLDACKKGFLAGCRRIISFDGCHVKDKFGGQILTAVGIDANDSIYPIAYAVVEAETRETWGWFFQLMSEDLEIQNSYCLTVMSDKQKVTFIFIFSSFSL